MASLFERLQSEIEARERVERVSPAELLDLPDELFHIVNMIWRRGQMSLAEIADESNMRSSEVRGLLDMLVEKGHLEALKVEGELCYKTLFARRRVRDVSLDIWEVLVAKLN